MSPAARSIFSYAIYVFGLGAVLKVAPNIPLPLFGLPEATEVWIRVAGMTVSFLSTFYVIAARNEFRPLFVASEPIRLSVPLFFAAFVIAGFAPWNLILFTPLDIAFAIWTWIALRRESEATPRPHPASWAGGSNRSMTRPSTMTSISAMADPSTRTSTRADLSPGHQARKTASRPTTGRDTVIPLAATA
jgi:hypothetical protein